MEKYFVFKRFAENTNNYRSAKDTNGYVFLSAKIINTNPHLLLHNFLNLTSFVSMCEDKCFYNDVTGNKICGWDDEVADFGDYQIIVFSQNEVLSKKELIEAVSRDDPYEFSLLNK